jgi:hypothetical protein
VPEGVERQDRERRPDQGEADPTVGRHRLVEPQHAEQELCHRRQVLQQPEDGQRQRLCRDGEGQQRHARHHAGTGQQ